MVSFRFLDTGYFKLDGGAMFGVVPRQLWQRMHAPDVNNMCTWAMRCLLIEQGDRKIIVDTGIGDKQDAKFRRHFEPHGTATLLNSLAALGVQPEEITDVLLTHLHFDHVGGAVRRTDSGELVTVFPEATYWSNEVHWNWATNPNPREAASFLPENILPLQHSGQLRFIDVQRDDLEWLPGIHVRFLYGHTEAMMMPILDTPNGRLVYAADLIPSSFHLGMPYVMAFDVKPLQTMEEKARLLEEAYSQAWTLAFEHDPSRSTATLTQSERGRIVLAD